MNLVVIYPHGDGIRVIHPALAAKMEDETDAAFASRVAAKDVPQGVPFLIIPQSDVPATRTDRHLWVADFTNPDGHGA